MHLVSQLFLGQVMLFSELLKKLPYLDLVHISSFRPNGNTGAPQKNTTESERCSIFAYKTDVSGCFYIVNIPYDYLGRPHFRYS